MVLGHVGRGDEEDGLGHQAELRDGAGAAARDDQVGRRIGVVHPLDEGPLPDAPYGVGRQEGLHLTLVVLARLPDDLNRGLAPAEREQPRLHHLVQGARAERAADNQHHLAPGREAEVVERLRTRRAALREAAAERVARQDDFLFGEEALHPLIGGADAAGAPRQNLVRHAGIGVLLLDDGRHPHALGGPQHRRARIAAEAHHHVGPEGADDVAGLADAPQHLEGDQQVVPLQTALQPGNRQPDDAVAQRRDLLHLHLALGADEEQFDLLAEAAPERLGHSHGRIDMTARAAARKNNAFHRIAFAAAVRGPEGPPAAACSIVFVPFLTPGMRMRRRPSRGCARGSSAPGSARFQASLSRLHSKLPRPGVLGLPRFVKAPPSPPPEGYRPQLSRSSER